MKINRHAFSIVVAVTFFISCNQQPGSKQPSAGVQTPAIEENAVIKADTAALTETVVKGTDPRIEGRKWILIQMMGERVEVSRSNKPAFIQFDPAALKFTGSGSCNSIFGTYKIQEGERISFIDIGGTRMACPDMTTENKLLEILGKIEYYRVTESELMFYQEKTSPIAVFALMKD